MAEKRKVLRVVDEQGNLEQVLFETSAEQVKVVDEGNYYSGDNAESVFQEIGGRLKDHDERLDDLDERLEEGVGKVDDVVNKDGTSLVTNKIAQVTPQNIGAIPTTEKGVANGVAQLDGSAKIPTTQLPDFLMGQVLYGGNVGAETQPLTINSVMVGLCFDTTSTLNVYYDFISGGANSTLIKVGEVKTTIIQNEERAEFTTQLGLVATNLDDPPQAELVWRTCEYKNIVLEQLTDDTIRVSVDGQLYYEGNINDGGSIDDIIVDTVVYRQYSDFHQNNGKPTGWLVDGLTFDKPITVTELNSQDIWGNYISYQPFISSGETPIIATLSNNAIKKLGVNNNSLNLTNDTTDKTGYVSNEGIYYIATTSFKFAGLSFKTGDWLISTGNAWTKIDNTDAVTGVKGNEESVFRTGNVIISPANIGLGNVDNTADEDKSVSHAETSGSATTASKLDHKVIIGLSGQVEGVVSTDFADARVTVSIALTDGAVQTQNITNGAVTKDKLVDVFPTDDNVFTAVSVDRKGRVVDGGSVIEWGTSGQTTPSANLMVGGLFFEMQ